MVLLTTDEKQEYLYCVAEKLQKRRKIYFDDFSFRQSKNGKRKNDQLGRAYVYLIYICGQHVFLK